MWFQQGVSWSVHPLPGEPFNRKRTFAPHWLTENAERESAGRFLMRVFEPAEIQRVCDDSCVLRTHLRRLSRSKPKYGVPFRNVRFPHSARLPVPNEPELSDSPVYRRPQVNRIFRHGVPFRTVLEPLGARDSGCLSVLSSAPRRTKYKW